MGGWICALDSSVGPTVAVYVAVLVVFAAGWVWAARALLAYVKLFESHTGRVPRDRSELFARQAVPVLEAARRAYLRRFWAFLGITACDVILGGAAWNALATR